MDDVDEMARRVSEQLQQENCQLMAKVTKNAIIETGNKLNREGARADLAQTALILGILATTMEKTARVHLQTYGPKPLRKLITAEKPHTVKLVRVPLPDRPQAPAELEEKQPPTADSPDEPRAVVAEIVEERDYVEDELDRVFGRR